MNASINPPMEVKLKLALSLLIPFFCCTHAQSSGCMPNDYTLETEQVVYSIGKFETKLVCRQPNSCELDVFNTEESHVLRPQAPHHQDQDFGQIGSVQVNIFRRKWSGSCDDQVDYAIGADINGVRFRDRPDLGIK